jgi:Protein of unknown function (DUF2490)
VKHHLKILLFFIVATFSKIGMAQNTRISDNNNIGWYSYVGTFKLDDKLSIHSEYQFRRDEIISNWQQSLIRVGINFNVNAKFTVRLGYGNIETFDYGDFPINSMGKNFTEHRTFQMATITDKINKIELSHRLMLEQRWIGRYTSPLLTREDDWLFLNRLRYMFRAQMPLKGNTIDSKTPYIAAYNEILIGFGKNVNENIFDQNRLGLLIGYKFSPSLRIEAGYFNQILQLGREIEGRNVFQYNNGLIINTIFNFDLTKKQHTK